MVLFCVATRAAIRLTYMRACVCVCVTDIAINNELDDSYKDELCVHRIYRRSAPYNGADGGRL